MVQPLAWKPGDSYLCSGCPAVHSTSQWLRGVENVSCDAVKGAQEETSYGNPIQHW